MDRRARGGVDVRPGRCDVSATSSTAADFTEMFCTAMREAGVPTSDEIHADGRLHRVHVEGDSIGSRNGWYVLHSDDPPAGAFGSWRTGVSDTWCAAASSDLTATEWERWIRKAGQSRHRQAEAQRHRQEQARERSARLWAKSRTADPGHPYLRRKGADPHGLRQLGDRLLIPVRGPDGTLLGLQRIGPDGLKRFIAGTEVRGSYHAIGTPDGVLIVAEGYATAATIHEATGHAVAVAFNCGNLTPVAKALRNKLGADVRIIIAADNDRDTEGNPGLTAATEAARTVGGLLATPIFDTGEEGSDFNDLAHLRGAEVVVERIGAASQPEPGHVETPLKWPKPLAAEAFHGPAGEFVRVVEPHSEADPTALLTGFLVMAGNAIGDGPHLCVEADEHPGRLFGVWVGQTAGGRKGVAQGRTRSAVVKADEVWVERVQSGLSSGEGLIQAVRDPVIEGEGDDLVVSDVGVIDKRLMVVEAEFASTLRVLGRDGNTLSPTLRNAWDSGRLQTMTKGSPSRATGAHISILGHITADELRRYLTATEAGNGFANRFLWICVRRSKALPFGGDLDPTGLDTAIADLKRAIEWAKTATTLTWAPEARPIWASVYPSLSAGRPGMLGAITSRAEAQTVRLATLYAALDRSNEIRPEHLHAALAVWDYALESARYIFGDDLGDPVADEILRALRTRPRGMTRNELRDHFQRHKSAETIGAALDLLRRRGLVDVSKVETGGRPAERWRSIG